MLRFNRFLTTVPEVTTFKNGLKLVTDSTPGHFSALGAYVNAGSRYEDPKKQGLSHIHDRLAFKSTEEYSGQQMLENLSKLGGNYMSSSQRESMIYQSSVFNKDFEKMTNLLAQTIRYPKFTDQEFMESLQTCDYEVQELIYKHDVNLPEKLHAIGYKDNTLGNSLFIPKERIPLVTRQDVLNYHDKFFQPQNIVIAMVGVPHEYAERLIQSHFGDWTNTSESAFENSRYTGGEISIPHVPPIYSNLPDLYHIQIGFETTGLLNEDLYSLATLQKLLGGGSSFSAGGPGKGMFSRLYTQVLNKHPFVENCMCFNHSYIDSGLFGISLSLVPEAGQISSQIICDELAKLLDVKYGINEREFSRAKNQLISSLLMNVESRLAKLEDLGRQIQVQGKITTIDEMVTKVEKLTIKDVTKVAEKVLTGSRPAIAMQGDREVFGDVEYILRRYGLGKFSGELNEPRSF